MRTQATNASRTACALLVCNMSLAVWRNCKRNCKTSPISPSARRCVAVLGWLSPTGRGTCPCRSVPHKDAAMRLMCQCQRHSTQHTRKQNCHVDVPERPCSPTSIRGASAHLHCTTIAAATRAPRARSKLLRASRPRTIAYTRRRRRRRQTRGQSRAGGEAGITSHHTCTICLQAP